MLYAKKKEYFRLGHCYDVTEYYRKRKKEPYYERMFINADVWDFHIYRLLVDFNSEYEREERTKILEQGDIPKDIVLDRIEEKLGKKIYKGRDVRNFPNNLLLGSELEKEVFKAIIEIILEEDDGDNDDLAEFRYDTEIEEIVEEYVDSGYGLTTLDENLEEKKGE